MRSNSKRRGDVQEFHDEKPIVGTAPPDRASACSRPDVGQRVATAPTMSPNVSPDLPLSTDGEPERMFFSPQIAELGRQWELVGRPRPPKQNSRPDWTGCWLSMEQRGTLLERNHDCHGR